jgi:GNAT superfamily N-acetyltransferase
VTCRSAGLPIRQNVVSSDATAIEHVRAAGYEPIQFYQRMRAALGDVPPAPAAPVRRFDPEVEGAAVHELIELAFSEIAAHAAQSFANWRAEVAAASEPAFRLVRDDEQGLAAAAVGERWENGAGYVSHLAVARRARGRGYGRTLLLALLNAFRDAGPTTAELSVAARMCRPPALRVRRDEARLRRRALGAHPISGVNSGDLVDIGVDDQEVARDEALTGARRTCLP